MARDFFLRLCRVDQESRYDAGEALKHPWITRELLGVIPLSIYDEFKDKKVREDFVDIVKLLFFLSNVQAKPIISFVDNILL